jgi:bacterial/archaeal transporter family-2 protein
MHYLIAVLAGLVLPVQVAFNSRLTSFTGSPIVSSLVSFLVGTLALILYTLTNPGMLQQAYVQVWKAPLYAWFGGLIGAFFIATSLVIAPKLGLAMSICLVIAGQLTMSVLMDQFGWFGFEVRPLTIAKGFGLILVFVGIVLIKMD